MPALAKKRAAQLDPAELVDKLDELRAAAAEHAPLVNAAQAKFDGSGRWYDAAAAKLRSYIEGVDAGEQANDPDKLAELRNAVTDLAATRTVREKRGSSTRYGDSRPQRALEEAQQAQQEADNAVTEFVTAHRENLQRGMLERSEAVRDEMLATFAAASASGHAWRRQRADWLALMERWGISPAELPPLPGLIDPHEAVNQGINDQQRAGGHVRHPRLLTPAPVSVQLHTPEDAGSQVPGQYVPDEQRRWPRPITTTPTT